MAKSILAVRAPDKTQNQGAKRTCDRDEKDKSGPPRHVHVMKPSDTEGQQYKNCQQRRHGQGFRIIREKQHGKNNRVTDHKGQSKRGSVQPRKKHSCAVPAG